MESSYHEFIGISFHKGLNLHKFYIIYSNTLYYVLQKNEIFETF